ncbi:hypothetical protein SAMD00019534_057010 [Acytostelium subglobosum LB1]|uniref:hypothetical protein n=1 Tax=Acytostelium subglobosum LB1 TaxID=1410327 RepID=UPI0006448764|nr:hypothetical protein SAMD00019534_057010 [Acytostelium subglobosum LB1]GAM22526.1 hypothetical protein SAMD00019534_057010 [Acytostelium subglobosum LB1]|eukprot:XP_012754646.1 hypothetical protein SAMD00019534_057010 [Acytostelium subglobosum LB1]
MVDDETIRKQCIGCRGVENEKDILLYRGKLIKVVLSTDNQCWLGRCVIVPDEHISPVDLYASRHDVYQEIGAAIAMMTRCYRHLFGMAYPNICQLGNLTKDLNGCITTEDRYHHVHFHYIPRYDKPVQYAGETFVDKQWGRGLNVDRESGLLDFKEVSPRTIQAIVTQVREYIDNDLPL